ncbi:MAG: gliding motility-associated C-terminal domain-containing protein, partial [Spirochaetes bacterium]|nr:gliding motility-associated C-terminal domain-containing protein [Spirochaetota bacterium]
KRARLDLVYFDLDHDGKVETLDGTETEKEEKNMALFWWDGFEWRYIGGSVNPSKNTVSASVSRLSLFALFSVDHLSKEAFRPKEKIITPNGDGINDIVYFGGGYGEFEIIIFDVNGREIRKINDLPQWDGKDSRGKYVESGVYIYQANVPVNGKMELMSGTIAVAK